MQVLKPLIFIVSKRAEKHVLVLKKETEHLVAFAFLISPTLLQGL